MTALFNMYYNSPWEYEADVLGGVENRADLTPWPDDAPTTFRGLIKLFW